MWSGTQQPPPPHLLPPSASSQPHSHSGFLTAPGEKWQTCSCPRTLAPDAPSTQEAVPLALHVVGSFESLRSWLKCTPFSDHPLQSGTPRSIMSPRFIAFIALRTLKILFSLICSLSIYPDWNVCSFTSRPHVPVLFTTPSPVPRTQFDAVGVLSG